MGFWEPLFFWMLAAGALASSIAVLVFRNPLYSALSLIVDFFCFAGLYVLLSAHFMAVTQILVYGGAIMVLFLFIIMLLNLSEEDLGPRRFSLHQILAAFAAISLFVFATSAVLAVVDFHKVDQVTDQAAKAQEVAEDQGQEPNQDVEVPSRIPGLYAFASEGAVQKHYADQIHSWANGTSNFATNKFRRYDNSQPTKVPPGLLQGEQAAAKKIGPNGEPIEARTSGERGTGSLFGTVEPISLLLVNRFVVPFELTAVLLLAAIIGAVIIAKKRL